MTDKLTKEAIAFVKKLSEWKTQSECEGDFEPTGDPFIDNTMEDIDKLVKKARKIMQGFADQKDKHDA